MQAVFEQADFIATIRGICHTLWVPILREQIRHETIQFPIRHLGNRYHYKHDGVRRHSVFPSPARQFVVFWRSGRSIRQIDTSTSRQQKMSHHCPACNLPSKASLELLGMQKPRIGYVALGQSISLAGFVDNAIPNTGDLVNATLLYCDKIGHVESRGTEM